MLSITRGTGRRGADGRGRRARGPLLISLAVNAGIVAVFANAVAHGYTWGELFARRPGEVPAERISFLRLPTGPTTQPGRSGGDAQPVSRGARAPVRPRPAAPSRVTAGPPEPVATTPGAGSTPGAGGTGAVVGQGGPTEGLRPTYADPRLWARPDVAVSAPRSAKERIDSVVADVLTPVRDSILAARALAAGQRDPGDWTMKGPGGKWGMDGSNIHLGKIKVPNALLAVLSNSFQQNLRTNPTLAANERRLAQARQEIRDHAAGGLAEDDFRGAVRAIRQRKDRERNARLAERRRATEEGGAVVGGAAQQDR
jgi:hypothetical protein